MISVFRKLKNSLLTAYLQNIYIHYLTLICCVSNWNISLACLILNTFIYLSDSNDPTFLPYQPSIKLHRVLSKYRMVWLRPPLLLGYLPWSKPQPLLDFILPLTPCDQQPLRVLMCHTQNPCAHQHLYAFVTFNSTRWMSWFRWRPTCAVRGCWWGIGTRLRCWNARLLDLDALQPMA